MTPLRRVSSSVAATGDDWAVADGLKMLTVTWFVQDDHERLATPEDLGAVATRRQQVFLAWYHCGLGYSALHRGQLDTARSELEASLDDCRNAGEPVTDTIANAYLGELEALTGQYDEARERLE